MERVESMPRAANEIPYMLAKTNEVKMVKHMTTTGMTHEWKPRAKPFMMLGAAPA
jgi:hypothetical protein